MFSLPYSQKLVVKQFEMLPQFFQNRLNMLHQGILSFLEYLNHQIKRYSYLRDDNTADEI